MRVLRGLLLSSDKDTKNAITDLFRNYLLVPTFVFILAMSPCIVDDSRSHLPVGYACTNCEALSHADEYLKARFFCDSTIFHIWPILVS
jgi:hypothetical protein